jgi:predicted lipoprotein
MKGTAVRDSMDFINFDDFTNQLEFANVSRELNNKIKAVVLNDLDREALQGKMVDFLGAFQWVEGKSILITPVELKPEE